MSTLPKLALIPSGYKASKVYSALPTNGDGDFTFSRTGNATRVNKDGLIETVGSNVPRLDYSDSNCPTLLLEPQRTNLALYSENFEGTNWSAGNTVITQNDSIAPSGEQTAIKLQRTSTSASYRTHFIYKSASAITYTTSVFVKQGEDNYFAMRSQGSYPSRVDIRFRFDTGLIYYAQATSGFTLIDYNVENYPNGWYRVYFTYTSDTHTNISLTFSPRETDGNIDSSDTSSNSFAYVWGGQTEVANYVSSYIKTEASAVTRTVDTCKLENFNNAPTDYPFTAFVDMDVISDETGFGFSIIDISTPNIYFSVGYSEGATNKFRFTNRSQGTVYSFNTTSTYGTGRYKIAIKFISSTNFKAFIDGVEVADYTHTSSAFNSNINDVLLGQLRAITDTGTRNPIHQFMIFNEALSDAELISLTT